MTQEQMNLLLQSKYGDEVSMAYIDLSQFAYTIVEKNNSDLVKIIKNPGRYSSLGDWNEAQKLIDIKHKELLDELIGKLPSLSKIEVEKLKKEYAVNLKLEDLEKDFL